MARDKLRTFQALAAAGVSVPPFWTKQNIGEAKRAGTIIIARTTTTGSGGQGIVIVREGDKLPDAPLYTKYIRKDAEYRLHVAGDKVLLIQQKRKETEVAQTDDQKLIRNRDNGWIFAVNNVTFRSEEQKNECIASAVAAVRGCGLDFGAVDLVTERATGKAFVLEINTAPGIESPTLLEGWRNYINSI